MITNKASASCVIDSAIKVVNIEESGLQVTSAARFSTTQVSSDAIAISTRVICYATDRG